MDRNIGEGEKIDYDLCLKKNFYEEFIDNVSIPDLILSILKKKNNGIVDKVLDKWRKKTNKGMNSNDRIWNSVDENKMKRGIRKVQKIWSGINEKSEKKQEENRMLESLKTKMEESWNQKGNEKQSGNTRKNNLETAVKNMKYQRVNRVNRRLEGKLIKINDDAWEKWMAWWIHVRENSSNNLDETHNEENGCIDDTGPAGTTLQAGENTTTQASTTVGISTSDTGISTSDTGISTSDAGISTSDTGIITRDKCTISNWNRSSRYIRNE
ncbi:hypothetical protein PCYB_006920 [Plasmodium cynomolgi strain B]|uniref:Uncharacterized protein n=1 Tax=Plasmodium cynomolgi (strain B) TaxID=1120755 RepID=K6UNZ4_PLACD|nr:hypothetical protein PCYB_006920 [Plasmodium cynomolgi strain B]GAB69943.1 hypothetical protein PCYB_006920 [Plasmodium cynomolgi strain B]